MPDSEAIRERAEIILALRPDPIPRYRVLRDLLDFPSDSPELLQAKRLALTSRWVEELGDEQLPNGSWGRFHSADSNRKQSIATTESAVSRCVELGLEGSEIARRASNYLRELLSGRLEFPDPPELNDRWPVGVTMFVGATLAELEARDPALSPIFGIWLEIAGRTFESGEYDADREMQAHREITHTESMKGSYLCLNNQYAVGLLSRAQKRLSNHIESAFVEWLWAGSGVRYIGVPPSHRPAQLKAQTTQPWFRTQYLLSRFRSWSSIARKSMEELWDLAGHDGLWDFGPTRGMRLSETWRKPLNRAIDHSVCVLRLQLAASRGAT
jgi:hypothetical protein